MCLVRLGRAAYVVGSVAFIAIGLLHTQVHLTELSTPELAARLSAFGSVPLGDDRVAMWDLWQGISLLMGAFSVALGAANLAALQTRSRPEPPPLGVAVVNVAMLLVIAFVGARYLGSLQAIGAPMGALLFSIAAASSRRAKRASA